MPLLGISGYRRLDGIRFPGVGWDAVGQPESKARSLPGLARL